MRRLFVALALVVAVAADPAAPHTLQEMVDSIKSGKFQNNFFGQKMVSATDAEAQVGGCLLDKVGAIRNENGFAKFPNDLKVDLGACCTKGNTASCVSEISSAYDDLVA